VGVHVPGIERDRLAERRDGLIELATRLQHDAEIAVPVGPGRREHEAPLDERHRLVMTALLVCNHTQVVHGVSVVRRLLEDRAIDVGRLLDVPALLALDADRHRVADGERVAQCPGRFHGHNPSISASAGAPSNA